MLITAYTVGFVEEWKTEQTEATLVRDRFAFFHPWGTILVLTSVCRALVRTFSKHTSKRLKSNIIGSNIDFWSNTNHDEAHRRKGVKLYRKAYICTRRLEVMLMFTVGAQRYAAGLAVLAYVNPSAFLQRRLNDRTRIEQLLLACNKTINFMCLNLFIYSNVYIYLAGCIVVLLSNLSCVKCETR